MERTSSGCLRAIAFHDGGESASGRLTVLWRAKPIFIRHRTAEEIKGKLRLQSVQRRMRDFREALLNKIAMRQEPACDGRPCPAPPNPSPDSAASAYHAGHRDVEAGRNLPTACPRRNQALTQNVRKESCHRCWPPPGQHLESLFAQKRTPRDSVNR